MILEARGLTFHYHNSRTIFENVSFDVDKGEIFTILGTNGAGKSTLLNCVANLYRPQSGDIYLQGRNIKEMSLPEIARVIGYVPQNHNAVYAYSVLEFVVMGRTPHIGMLSSPKKEDYDIAMNALEQMNIAHLAAKPYTEISGGERQLALIARVITQRPDLIMLDEPTSHLDYGNQFRTVSMIKTLSQMGYGVIMTTHMPDHAIILNDKVGILDRYGHLSVGQAEDVLTDESLSDLYQIKIKTQFLDIAGRRVCVTCSDDNPVDLEGIGSDYIVQEGIQNKEDYLWSNTKNI